MDLLNLEWYSLVLANFGLFSDASSKHLFCLIFVLLPEWVFIIIIIIFISFVEFLIAVKF